MVYNHKDIHGNFIQNVNNANTLKIEWIKKLWQRHIIECYSEKKKKKKTNVVGDFQLPGHVPHFATTWTVAHQAFLSLTISWSSKCNE